jgi:hypothetical protein
MGPAGNSVSIAGQLAVVLVTADAVFAKKNRD